MKKMIFELCVKHEKLEKYELLHKKKFPKEYHIFDQAIKYDNLTNIKWLIKNGYENNKNVKYDCICNEKIVDHKMA
jgi:hypothetical protein